MSGIKGLAREPLVHFLIAGAALFALNGLYGETDSGGRSISIDEEQVARLAGQWEQQWRRQPSPKELEGLIRNHIKDEIYYREAIRLGLDVGDPIIRQRLRNKMEFLATAQAENTPPTNAELSRYYAANQARYAADPAFSFDQRYHGEDEATARDAVVTLNAGRPIPALLIPLPVSMETAAKSEIAKAFGNGFADGLGSLPKGRWAGPVKSGFGWHAVRVRAVEAAEVPPLAEIRQRVTNDWRSETSSRREAAAYQALLDGYDIRIEKP